MPLTAPFASQFDIYLETFKTLHAYPALHTVEDEQRFTRLLEKVPGGVIRRHAAGCRP